MKFRFVIPGLVILALFVAACSPPPVLRNEKLLNDTSLVSSEPCAAPCWNGITPGETGWSDALTIVEDDSSLTDPEVQNAQEGPAVGARWSKVDGDACCQMVSENGETVSYISLSFAPEMTVEQVLETHGEPTYALGVPVTDDQAAIYLFYPEKAFIVVSFVAGAKAELKPESEVIGALYAIAEDMDLTIKTSKLHTWEGYAPFATYSQEAPDADFEVTPSVTLTPTPAS
ncbi:MAG TPA: hypothetical protein VHO69_18470 [Phototrophicaceae bacterium]|nr:hypothetical protein [Phototrophicaceae bacterium]